MLDAAHHHIISIHPVIKHTIDAVVIAGIPLTIIDWPHMPGLYEFLGVVWISIRIYETSLVQRILDKIKHMLGFGRQA